jgi:CRP-like cAMP-binding protein
MTDANMCELIKHSSFADNLSDEQCDVLAKLTKSVSLDDGQALIEEGKVDNTLHIVASGRLAVERNAGAGTPVTLHILKEGDLAGELGFVDGAEHTATLRAVGPTLVLSITRDDLESLLTTRADVVYAVMRGIVRTVHRILRQMNLQWVELSNYISKTHGRY